MAFIDTDEIIYEVPSYYKVEHLPESVSFESDFGSYAAIVSKEGNQITYARTLKFNKNTYPAERYDDLLKFSTRHIDEVYIAESDKGKSALYKIKAYPTFKLETSEKVYEMKGPPSTASFRAFLISALGEEKVF